MAGQPTLPPRSRTLPRNRRRYDQGLWKNPLVFLNNGRLLNPYFWGVFVTGGGTWRIIPFSKELVTTTTIYKTWKGRLEGEQPYLGDLLIMGINHLLIGMILQVGWLAMILGTMDAKDATLQLHHQVGRKLLCQGGSFHCSLFIYPCIFLRDPRSPKHVDRSESVDGAFGGDGEGGDLINTQFIWDWRCAIGSFQVVYTHCEGYIPRSSTQ